MFKRLSIIYIICMASLCSISYEVVLARFVSIILDNEVLGQSITIAVFLLGMGLGAVFYKKKKNLLKSLFQLELSIAVFSSLLPFLILIIISFLDAHDLIRTSNLTTYRYDVIFGFIEILVLILGFLTGLELPLFIDLGKEKEWDISTEKILFINYLGSLFSILFIFMFLDLGVNSLLQIIYLSIYNTIILFVILLIAKFPYRIKVLVFIPVIFQFYAIKSFPTLYNLYKKTYYFSIKINSQSPDKYFDFLNVNEKFGNVTSIQTKYQEIDLVESHSLINSIQNYDYTLYLDRNPQFSVDNVVVYHQSFAHVPIHLTKIQPEKVLVLGGGDGLLAHELLKYPTIKEIKIIELDKRMVQVAENEYQILKVNSNSLSNKRVNIVYENALSYIRKLSNQSIDAIFIDFPYPNNFELLKLYSYEFYNEVYRVLSEKGFAILDAPVISPDFPEIKENDFLQLFFNTVTKSGFKTFFPFGTSEPFIILSKEETKLKFNYKKLPSLIGKRTYSNLISFEDVVSELKYDPRNINSIFRPGRFNNE
jgi:spermidine synthase